MQIPANALLTSAVLGLAVSHGAARPAGATASRWIASAASAGAACVLAFLLQRDGRAELLALQAENALLSGRLGEAVLLAREGIGIRPDHARLQRMLGEAYLRIALASPAPRRFYLAAAKNLGFAVDFDPGERGGQLLLGMALGGLGDRERAETAFVEAIRLDPGSPVPCEFYGQFLESAGRPQEAVRFYEAALACAYSKTAAQRLRALRLAMKRTP